MSQIAGAYTDENNNEAMYFSTPLVEGEKIIIELNIENYVNLDDISLTVSSIIHDYRGIIQMRTNNNSDRQCGNDVFCEDAQNFIDQIHFSKKGSEIFSKYFTSEVLQRYMKKK